MITRFTRKIEEFGPLGSLARLSPEELKHRLATARAAVTDVKLRTRLAQLTRDMREMRDYSEEALAAHMAEKIDPALAKVLALGDGGVT